jgi:hypothetical protein
VERALAGDHLDLHPRDLDEVVRRLHAGGHGINDVEIADRVGVTVRTVLRSRKRQGLPPIQRERNGVA